MIFMQEE